MSAPGPLLCVCGRGYETLRGKRQHERRCTVELERIEDWSAARREGPAPSAAWSAYYSKWAARRCSADLG